MEKKADFFRIQKIQIGIKTHVMSRFYPNEITLDLKIILSIDLELPKVQYSIFEDNNSCIELLKCPKIRPMIKYIGSKFHHFRSNFQQGFVTVKYCDAEQ